MDISSLFQQLGIALGLGLLVGLQRESAASPLAGVRTFPLVTVLGTVCGLLSQAFGGWILAVVIIALVVIIYIGKIIEMSKGHPDPGITINVCAFPNDLRGYSRVSHNHHSFDWLRDSIEIGIARVPLYLRDIRIERIDLVTSALQLPVYCIGRLLKVPRDASNSDVLLA